MRKLLVISEPNIIFEKKCTRNNALNNIMQAYCNYFDEVHYLGSTNDSNIDTFLSNDIYYHPIRGYSKDIYTRFKFYLFTFLYKKEINNIIDNIKPDLIQVRVPSFFSSAIYKVVKEKGIPIISYIAGEWDEALKLNYKDIPFINFIAKRLFNSQKQIVSNTIPVCTGDLLKERFAECNKDCYAFYSTTHNTINKRTKFSHPAYKILSVGRLEKLKRNEDAIYALSYLLKDSDKYELTFIGDGIEKENLVELVKSLNLENNIHFLGHVSNKKELSQIFETNDILLHTSLSEGTTKVLPEAMSYGLLPIAVKNVGSNNYILASNNGYLIEAENPESIAECIKRYNNLESEIAAKIIDNCYKYAEEHTLTKELDKMWVWVFNKIKNENCDKL